ncbi:MAG: 4-(cytidine 5'-diphospho)-2-C-methyl-D-erythritol kinase [Planctomycetes bacterium]|nr:4-(cytidine 5'-diphospho)-2-C-methyl-D-erythritol kinase [Planctomycetota bacterium]
MNGPTFRARAPAKVNLTLEVLARRPDGYHEIRSWMLALDLHDRVAVRRDDSAGVRLTVRGAAASPDVPADERNLAARAGRAALERARARGLWGAGTGLLIELEKAIPSQAGLGGGSSDAAAAWAAACAALGYQPTEPEAEQVLAGLGSDCVFFHKAREGIGIASGRGEVVERVRALAPPWWVALIVPACGAPTAAVYARALPRDPARPSLRPDLAQSARHAAQHLENDLERAALAAVAELARWRELLDAAGAGAWRLAGSGSAWFGLYDDEREARAELAAVATRAARCGLGTRLTRVVRAAGHGAGLAPES